MKVYLDNSSTSYPKPEQVYNSMLNFMKNIGANPGRGGYDSALQSDRIIYSCRNSIAKLFNFEKIENIIFTQNISVSLNILIQSVVKEGWHVITSSMDHNSVLRPLFTLKNSGKIKLDILECSEDGLIKIQNFKALINKDTKLVVISHASNVIGTIEPIEEIGRICKEKGIYLIIDAAQTAGVLDIDFYKLNCSALAFTGHKALLGPQGIGGFLITDDLNNIATTFMQGGTGSQSQDTCQPSFLPDKFEIGTLNTPGIAGLLSGISYLNTQGITNIREKEQYLTNTFIEGLLEIESIKVYGIKDALKRTATISINSTKINNAELGYILDSQYGVMVRTGLHCAPLAHKSIGTFPQGTMRFSFGPFNDIKDINYTLNALNTIIKRK